MAKKPKKKQGTLVSRAQAGDKDALARVLANPGLRSRLPDRYLSSEQRASRAMNRRNQAPFVEGSPLTYGDVARERQAAETLRYGPAESQIAQQVRGSQQQEANIGGWFDQYKATVAAQTAASQARYAQAQQDLAGRTQASTAAAGAENQRLTQQMQQDAASRGATYGGQPSADMSAAAASRRSLADAFANALSQQGVAQADYYGARQGVGESARIGEHLRERERRGEIGRAGEELAREKGAFRTQYMGDRRDQESKSVLERAIFGQEVTDAEAKRKADAAKAKQAAKDKRLGRGVQKRGQTLTYQTAQDRIAADRAARSDREAAAAAKQAEKDRKEREKQVGKTREKSSKVQTQIDQAVAVLQNPKRPKGPQTRASLIAGMKLPGDVADAAIAIYQGKPISRALAKRLNKLGYRVPRKYLEGTKQNTTSQIVGAVKDIIG